MVMKKKKRGSNKASVDVKARHANMDSYKYDSKPSNLMSTEVDKQSPADRELKRMVKGDVWRSSPGRLKATNTNPRRNK